MPTYQVITYALSRARKADYAVKRVECGDEASALYCAVQSLVVAATQPGSHYVEWWPGQRNQRAKAERANQIDRAYLRRGGDIVLALAHMRPAPRGQIPAARGPSAAEAEPLGD